MMRIAHRTLFRLPVWQFISFLLLLSSSAGAVVLPVTGDTYSDAKSPGANYGGSKRLNIASWAPHQTYMQFDTAGLSTGSAVSNAVLKIRVEQVNSAGRVRVYLPQGSWAEKNLTANNAPATANSAIASFNVAKSDVGKTLQVDVTAAVDGWLQGKANRGLTLVADAGANLKIASREGAGGASLNVTLQLAGVRPNVVVVMVDDLDADPLKRMLKAGLMPALEENFVAKGTNFANMFVTTSWCCPSRATLFTGQYSHNHKVYTNSRPLGGVIRFDDSSTLATWMQAAGYRTGLVGKYLNNYGNDKDPSTPVDDVGYVPPGWDDWQVLMGQNTDGLRDFAMYNYAIIDNGRLVRYGSDEDDYQTDVLARRSRQFIFDANREADDQPFFLLVTPVAPHLEQPEPLMAGCENSVWKQSIRPAPRHIGSLPGNLQLPRPPSFNEADMSDKPPWFRQTPAMTAKDIDCAKRQYRDRLNSLRAVDDLVAGVADALKKTGETANTVLMFTSDNGYFHGQHRLAGKVLGYEESIRVPLYITAPGYPVQTTWRAALNNDLAPTIVELAAAKPGLAMDGRSLWPLMKNPYLKAWRKRFLVEYLGTVQTDRVPPRVPFTAVRTTNLPGGTPTNQYYLEWHDGLGSKEFYDLASDRYQISSQHKNSSWSGVRTTLAAWLDNLRDCGNGSCQLFEDN